MRESRATQFLRPGANLKILSRKNLYLRHCWVFKLLPEESSFFIFIRILQYLFDNYSSEWLGKLDIFCQRLKTLVRLGVMKGGVQVKSEAWIIAVNIEVIMFRDRKVLKFWAQISEPKTLDNWKSWAKKKDRSNNACFVYHERKSRLQECCGNGRKSPQSEIIVLGKVPWVLDDNRKTYRSTENQSSDWAWTQCNAYYWRNVRAFSLRCEWLETVFRFVSCSNVKTNATNRNTNKSISLN